MNSTLSRKLTGAIGAVALASSAVLAAGCTSHSPSVSIEDFTAGTCREIAHTVLDVGRLADEADDRDDGPSQVQPALTANQEKLRALRKAPPMVRDLVVAIGFFRIGLDSHTYRPQLLDDVASAQRGLQ